MEVETTLHSMVKCIDTMPASSTMSTAQRSKVDITLFQATQTTNTSENLRDWFELFGQCIQWPSFYLAQVPQ